MRALCRANTGKALPPTHFSAAPGDTEETAFCVSIGKEYLVLGVALWHSVILLLVLDDTNLPYWYPVELFCMTDARLPDDWFFSVSAATEHGVQAIWGYEHLVTDSSHYGALLERDPEALRLFYQEEWRRRSESSKNPTP